MNANKVIVSIEVETLSLDSVPAMITKAHEQISNESTNGCITMDDGDSVSWTTTTKPISF